MTSGLLDTSVAVDWHDPMIIAAPPEELAISAITAAELADLLIAATAHANRLDLYTRSGDDFVGLEGVVRVIGI